MMKQRHSLVLIMLTAASTAVGVSCLANESSTWLQVLSGPSYGALFDAVLTGDDVIAVGASNHRHRPPYSGDVLLVRVAVDDGSVVWERTWGGDGYEQAWGIVSDRDNGFYVFGETDSHGAGDRDFFLLKIDSQGEEVWLHTYGTPAREWPFGILALAGGDLLMYGETRSEDGEEDPYAVRVDPAGSVRWEYVDHAATDGFFLDALEAEGGHVILSTAVAEDGALTALDRDGRQLWTRRYELDGWQYASTISGTDDGYLLAGFWMNESGTSRQVDVWIAKASIDGELEWHKSFGDEESDDYAMSMIRLSDGNYLAGGLGQGLPLWKVNGSGDVLWERRLDNPSVHATGATIELSDGGFLVTGLRSIVDGQSSDAVLLRADARGRVEQ